MLWRPPMAGIIVCLLSGCLGVPVEPASPDSAPEEPRQADAAGSDHALSVPALNSTPSQLAIDNRTVLHWKTQSSGGEAPVHRFVINVSMAVSGRTPIIEATALRHASFTVIPGDVTIAMPQAMRACGGDSFPFASTLTAWPGVAAYQLRHLEPGLYTVFAHAIADAFAIEFNWTAENETPAEQEINATASGWRIGYAQGRTHAAGPGNTEQRFATNRTWMEGGHVAVWTYPTAGWSHPQAPTEVRASIKANGEPCSQVEGQGHGLTPDAAEAEGHGGPWTRQSTQLPAGEHALLVTAVRSAGFATALDVHMLYTRPASAE